MTREEAIKILRREIECLSHTKCEDCILEASCNPIKTTPYDSEYIEVYEMAIKALEQEPCDDAVSRDSVYGILMRRDFVDRLSYEMFKNRLEQLPPVNPQEPKTGHWIDEVTFIGAKICKCSECNFIIPKPRIKNNFCPNCGARMESEG